MANNTVFFVTGGNRGIGLGLVESLVARSDSTVIASVRNAEATAHLQSQNFMFGQRSTQYIIQLDFSTTPSPTRILEILNTTIPHLHRIDVLINNAAFIPPLSSIFETSLVDLRQTFETNTCAPLMVFQAL